MSLYSLNACDKKSWTLTTFKTQDEMELALMQLLHSWFTHSAFKIRWCKRQVFLQLDEDLIQPPILNRYGQMSLSAGGNSLPAWLQPANHLSRQQAAGRHIWNSSLFLFAGRDAIWKLRICFDMSQNETTFCLNKHFLHFLFLSGSRFVLFANKIVQNVNYSINLAELLHWTFMFFLK